VRRQSLPSRTGARSVPKPARSFFVPRRQSAVSAAAARVPRAFTSASASAFGGRRNINVGPARAPPRRAPPALAAKFSRYGSAKPIQTFKAAKAAKTVAPARRPATFFVPVKTPASSAPMMCSIFIEVDGETKEVADPNCGGGQSQARPVPSVMHTHALAI
jgi:hypothetical protein